MREEDNNYNLPEIEENLEENIKNHRLKYKRLYIKLIKRCQSMSKEELSGYNEKHHILPKCLGGLDVKDNLVLMPVRYHIMAHIILLEVYPNISGIAYAVHCMIHGIGNKKFRENRLNSLQKHFSTRTIANSIELAKEKLRGENNPRYGKKSNIVVSEETREKLRKASTGRIVSETTREKLRKANSGKIVSESTRKKLREANLGKKASEETKQKMKGKFLGEKSPCYNIPRTDGVKKVLSEKTRNNWKLGKYKNVSEALRRGNSPIAKKVVGPDNTIYDCVKDAIEASGVSHTTLLKWARSPEGKNHGWRYLDPQSIVKKPKAKSDKKKYPKGSDSVRSKKIIGPDGTIYGCAEDAEKLTGIKKDRIKSWARGNTVFDPGWYYLDSEGNKIIPKRKETIISNTCVKVIGPNGDVYNSIKEASEQNNIDYHKLYNWINSLNENNNPGWRKLE